MIYFGGFILDLTTIKVMYVVGSWVWWRWFWGQGSCVESVGAVVLAGDNNVAILDHFVIVLGEDLFAVFIADLSD